MKTKLQVLTGCVVGLAATVAFVVGVKAPTIGVNQERPTAAIRTAGGDGPEGKSRPHPSFRPSPTRAGRHEDPATFHSHAASQRRTRFGQAAGSSISPTEVRNHHSDAQSRSPGEVVIRRKTTNDNGLIAQRRSPSASGFPAPSSRRFQEKRSREISEPLIFTDPGSIVSEEPGRDAALHEAARQLAIDLAAPGHPPDSPEYLDHWNRTVDLSNQLLRQRYGGQVWMAHHIQSHHFQTASGEENP